MDDMIGTSGMGADSIMAQTGYNNDPWASISPYSQSPYGNSPMNEYSNFNYMHNGIPAESMHRMPPPSTQTTQSHQLPLLQPAPGHMAHHQLPALNTTWPSQLTNPTPTGGSYSAPPLSMTPVSSVSSAPPPLEHPRPPPQQQPHDKSRKTLSMEQKRAMCQYSEDHPGTRQADIGAKFGVERSTVSKVLRYRDQYLKRDADKTSNGNGNNGSSGGNANDAASKYKKGKQLPDFDRTLSNYVKRQQQSGFRLTDDEIMEQAQLFARGSNFQNAIVSNLTPSWLQKFKQKHGIAGWSSSSSSSLPSSSSSRLTRRASEANIPDSARMSMSTTLGDSRKLKAKAKAKKAAAAAAAAKDASGFLSPTSPTSGCMSPLSEALSETTAPTQGHHCQTPNEIKQEGGVDVFFGHQPQGQEDPSSTSLLTNDVQDASASFSPGGALSPLTTNAPFSFSPDPDTGCFAIDSPNSNKNSNNDNDNNNANNHNNNNNDDNHRNNSNNNNNMYHREKRSNTFPSLNLEAIHQQQQQPQQQQQHKSFRTSPKTPRYILPRGGNPSSALNSPVPQLQVPFPIDTTIASPPSQSTQNALRRTSSNSSMTRGGSTGGGGGNTPVNGNSNHQNAAEASTSLSSSSTSASSATTSTSSPPMTPSQEDACRAAATLLSYIQNMGGGGRFQVEFDAVMGLTKKLQLGQQTQGGFASSSSSSSSSVSSSASSSAASSLASCGQQGQQQSRQSVAMGGLSRIPEGDAEMSTATELAAETG